MGSQFKVHPMQIAKWRKAALEELPELFVDGRKGKARSSEAETDALYEEIDRLKVELDWLKKSRPARLRIDGRLWRKVIRRSAFGGNAICWDQSFELVLQASEQNLQLMRLIDEQYMRTPFHGSRRMAEWLRTKGFEVTAPIQTQTPVEH
jgi:putative transposase